MTKARSPTTRTIQPANGKTRIGTGYLLSRRHTKWRATPCRPSDSFQTPLAAKTCCRQGRRACRRRSGTVQGQRPARAGPRGSIVPLRRRRARRTRRRALRPRRHWLMTRCAACGTRRALCTATRMRVRACAASERDTRHGQQAVSSQPQRTPSPMLSPASSTSSRRREAGFGARPTGCRSKMQESRHFKTQARRPRRCWCSDLTSGGHGAPRRVRRGCFRPARAPPPRPQSAP